MDFDGSPTWSPDGKRIAFIRRPGTPFGAQTQQGNGGIGNPGGPGAVGAQGAARGGRGNGGGGGGGGGGSRRVANDDDAAAHVDGLYRAAFPGG